MPLRFYIMVLLAAMLAAGLTIFVASVMLPGAVWAGPGVMAVLAICALAFHMWQRRK